MVCCRASAIFASLLPVHGPASGASRETLISGIYNRFEQNREIALAISELADQESTELLENRGSDFNSAPLPGERAAALDYRLKQ